MSVWLELAPHQCSYTNQRAPSILTRKGAVLAAMPTLILNSTASSSLEQFPGIAIPIFGTPPRASGGSGEGGRGIREENLKLWAWERSRFHTRAEGTVLAADAVAAGKGLARARTPASSSRREASLGVCGSDSYLKTLKLFEGPPRPSEAQRRAGDSEFSVSFGASLKTRLSPLPRAIFER